MQQRLSSMNIICIEVQQQSFSSNRNQEYEIISMSIFLGTSLVTIFLIIFTAFIGTEGAQYLIPTVDKVFLGNFSLFSSLLCSLTCITPLFTYMYYFFGVLLIPFLCSPHSHHSFDLRSGQPLEPHC